jgi:hypothetical protein
MANALLTYPGALGYVTELLSGDFATPFGRSSHHQVWSEAMVVSPLIRGMLGIEVTEGGRTMRFSPAIPPTWDRVEVRRVRAGTTRCDLTFERSAGRAAVRIARHEGELRRLVVAPAFPLDARVQRVSVNGVATKFQRVVIGDVQRIEVATEASGERTEVVFSLDEGTDVYVEPNTIELGAANEGLRVIRVKPDANALRLTVEGRGGRAYGVTVRSPRKLGESDGVRLVESTARDQRIEIRLTGSAEDYVRREIVIPLR